jgi:hypothetical protein
MHIVLGYGSGDAVQVSRSHAHWVLSPDYRVRRRAGVSGKPDHEEATIRRSRLSR